MKKWIYLLGVAAVIAAPEAMARAVRAPAPAPEAAPSLAPSSLPALPQPNFDVLGGPLQYKAGVSFMSENIWRGISITNHRPGAMAYGEIGKGWFYLGGDVLNVTLPTSPAAQLDIYGGVRPQWGPLTLDFGAVYHGRPGNQQQYFLGGLSPVLTFWTPGGMPTTPFDQSFVEIYAKPSWALNDYLTLGGQLAYAPNWNRYNAHSLYSEINAKVTPFANTDYSGLSISGAFGHYYLGMSDASYGGSYIDPDYAFLSTGILGTKGFKFASYNTWNVGASYNWNVVTLDLRYYDSNLTRAGCFLNTSDPSGNMMASLNTLTGQSSSSWCGSRFVASLSVDFSSATFK